MMTDQQARELKEQFRGKVDSALYLITKFFENGKTTRGNVILSKHAQKDIIDELEKLKK